MDDSVTFINTHCCAIIAYLVTKHFHQKEAPLSIKQPLSRPRVPPLVPLSPALATTNVLSVSVN